MKFLSVMPNLYVADVEASAAFYRDQLGGTETFRTPAAGTPVHVGHRRGYVADPDGNWVVLVSEEAA